MFFVVELDDGVERLGLPCQSFTLRSSLGTAVSLFLSVPISIKEEDSDRLGSDDLVLSTVTDGVKAEVFRGSVTQSRPLVDDNKYQVSAAATVSIEDVTHEPSGLSFIGVSGDYVKYRFRADMSIKAGSDVLVNGQLSPILAVSTFVSLDQSFTEISI